MLIRNALISLLAICITAVAQSAIPIGRDGLPYIAPASVIEVETVKAPASILLSNRGTDRVKLTWIDRTSLETSYKILRRGASGAYQVIKTYAALSGQISYVNTGLAQDAFYCYRIQVANSTDSALTDEYCVFTRATEARPLFRAQLEIETGDVSDAGTDNPVKVQLNTGKFLLASSDNYTWLNYGQDDFERGSTFVYDLLMPRDLSDITQLTLTKEGTDGWCVKRVSLIANASDGQSGEVVFEHNFATATQACHWIDGDDGHQPRVSFLHSDLRAHPSWPAPDERWFCGLEAACAADQLPLTVETLEQRIEGYIGHVIHDISAYGITAKWDGNLPLGVNEWVNVTPLSYDRARIELYLELGVPNWFNPDVYFVADLAIQPIFHDDGTGTAAIVIEDADVNISADLIAELLSALPCAVPVGGVVMIEETGTCNVIDLLGNLAADFIRTSIPAFDIPSTEGKCLQPFFNLDQGGDIYAGAVPCYDYDSDGMPNDWEIANGLDPASDDANEDPDDDGHTNIEEYQEGTDPLCAWPLGHENYCRDCGPCAIGEGDCDSDNQCYRGLVCVNDAGADYGLPATVDVCKVAPPTLPEDGRLPR